MPHPLEWNYFFVALELEQVRTALVMGSLAGQTLFRGCEEYSLVKLHRLTCFCTFSNYQNGVGPSDYFDVIKLARAF